MDFGKIIFLLIAVPFSTYFTVKFGRYGFLKANQIFAEQQNQNKTKT